MSSFGWFPISKDMLYNPDFISLTKSEKMIYIYLICEMNGHESKGYDKPYYKSDLDFSISLKLSVDTIRKARSKFNKLGWLKYRPGSNIGKNGNLATTYFRIKWCTTENGKQFFKIDRFTFYLLNRDMFNGVLKVEDILYYIYLSYFEMKYKSIKEEHPIGFYIENHEYDFFVTKKELRSIFQFPNEKNSFKRLVKSEIICGRDAYTKIIILRLATYKDPLECKGNLDNYELHLKNIQEATSKARNKQKIKIKKKAQLAPTL